MPIVFIFALQNLLNYFKVNVTVEQFEAASDRESTAIVVVTLAEPGANRLKQALTSLELGSLNRQSVTQAGELSHFQSHFFKQTFCCVILLEGLEIYTSHPRAIEMHCSLI